MYPVLRTIVIDRRSKKEIGCSKDIYLNSNWIKRKAKGGIINST